MSDLVAWLRAQIAAMSAVGPDGPNEFVVVRPADVPEPDISGVRHVATPLLPAGEVWVINSGALGIRP